MEQWIADFETTTTAYSTEKTFVWLWYLENIDSEKCYYGVDIDSYFKTIKKELKNKSHIIYHHNLSFDGQFIINWLVDNACYVYSNQQNKIKLKTNQWTALTESATNIFSITYKITANTRIEFRCSYKLIPLSVSSMLSVNDKKRIDYNIKTLPKSWDDVSNEQKQYIKLDVQAVKNYLNFYYNYYGKIVGITSASTSRNGIVKEIDKDNFNKYFVNKISVSKIVDNTVEPGEWEQLKNAYRGGWTYVNETNANKLIENVICFDATSMYPSVMRSMKVPVGKEVYCKDKNCIEHLKIFKITISAKLKDKNLPCIPERSIFGSTSYLRECTNHTISITEDELELIKQTYHIYDLKLRNQHHFMYKENLFTNFINHYYDIKKNSKDLIERTVAKLILNASYGKFGMKQARQVAYLVPYNKNDKDVTAITRVYGQKNPMRFKKELVQTNLSEYIPVAIWITSLSRIRLLTLINKINNICNCDDECFIYADTDSITFRECKHKQEILKHINTGQNNKGENLDEWKLEKQARYGYFAGRKFYFLADSLDEVLDKNKCAVTGVDKNRLKNFTLKDVINKTITFQKLQKAFINGYGEVLIEREINKQWE